MSVIFIDRDFRYGCHVQKYPSMVKTIKEVTDKTNYSAMQIYIANSRSKSAPKFDYEDLCAAKKILESHKEIYLVIHGCLLYNLAGTVNGKSDSNYHYALSSSIFGMISELDYAIALGRPDGVGIGVIVHPGSRKDKKSGHLKVSASLVDILTRKTKETEIISKDLGITQEEVLSRRKVILENSAGEGTKLCSTLEEIAGVIQGVPKKLRKQVKVCIDTAHAFGRGIYDWGLDGEIERFYEDFERIIGLEYLEVFHFNDSSKSDDKRSDAPFGSRKDRHQLLGFGYIFGSERRFSKILTFMQMALKHKIPVIGEPPAFFDSDWQVVTELSLNTKNPLETK